MNYYDTIIECVVMPAVNAINAAKPIGAEPLLLHPSPSNRIYLLPLQDVDEEEGDIYENEPNKVCWNMLHSGHLTSDQEERRQTNINRSPSASPTPSSVSHPGQRNADRELISDLHHRHQQDYQRQGMGRYKFSRLSAGGTVINRSLALNSTTSQMKQGKAVWRQLATKVKARRNLTEDYGVIKSVCRSVGERPEGMYEEQNLIRQELRHH